MNQVVRLQQAPPGTAAGGRVTARRDTTAVPVAVVGAGPVGLRVATELLRLDPTRQVLLFGEESWQPYNRVRLTALLAGDVRLEDLYTPLPDTSADRLHWYVNCRVVSIDRERRTLRTADGSEHAWSHLVLATGSRPHIPEIAGIDKQGVFTFRGLDDAQRLAARRARARQAVVLGGGLLGLETAKGLRRSHTEVVVIDHGTHLMSQQLDIRTAQQLAERVQQSGIRVITRAAVRRVLGDASVTGVLLADKREIACDTLVVATGIRPEITLARQCGLGFGRGIRVDALMRTSDPRIYAAGECAEYDGRVLGIVAPGLEQANVVARSIVDDGRFYTYADSLTRLKVFDTPVYSIGRIVEDAPLSQVRSFCHRGAGIQQRIFVRRGRVIGACGIGDAGDLSGLQAYVRRRRLLLPGQAARFERTGQLTLLPTAPTARNWPADATVCNCMCVSRDAIGQSIASGCTSVAAVSAATGAGTVCGSCKPLLADLLGGEDVAPETGARALVTAGVFALLAALLVVAPWSLPYADSVATMDRWDWLWRDGFMKQVSGFALLGAALLISLISVRKRVQRFRFLDYGIWRLAHVVTGVLALLLLVAHTGLRAGHALNAALMLSFTGLVAAGAVAGLGYGLRHRAALAGWSRPLTDTSVWLHILFLAPLPVLLGFHVLKSYWY